MDALIISEKADRKLSPVRINKILKHVSVFEEIFNRIFVVAAFDTSRVGNTKVSEKTVFHRIGIWEERGKFIRLLYYLFYLLALFRSSVKILKSNRRIKVVSNLWGLWTIGVITIFVSKLFGRKSIIRVDADITLPTFRKRFGPILGRIVFIILSKFGEFVFSNADLILPVSPVFLDKYLKYEDKTIVISQLFPVLDKYCDRKIKKIVECRDHLQILYVGRLEPEKGVEVLLEALKDLKNVRCSIIGTGFLKDELEKKALDMGLQNSVTFHGMLQQEKVFEFMEQSDVFVLPSYIEYTPNVLLEAAAIGVPIIASNVAGIKHLLKNGETGVLFNRGNPDELRKKIIFLMNNPQIRDKLRENAKEYFCRHFKSSIIKAKAEKVIKRLMYQNS